MVHGPIHIRFHSQLNKTFPTLYVFAQIISRRFYRHPFFLLCNEIKIFLLKNKRNIVKRKVKETQRKNNIFWVKLIRDT